MRKHRGGLGRPPRVGIFGKLGSGNFGNDASLEAVLGYLRRDHPEAVIDAMCTGPDTLRATYGIDAVHMLWHNRFQPDSAALSLVLKVLGRGLDTVRTAAWVRRHDAVIVAGAGVLETSLPMLPRSWPYALYLLSLYGKIFSTKVALVSVGAGEVNKPTTRWLFDRAVKYAYYRSYRDNGAREVMRAHGLDVSGDSVYPDLAFALSAPAGKPADDRLVAVGVMAFYGNDAEREQADEIYARYMAGMKRFVNWLVENDRKVVLIIGDTNGSDNDAAQEILAEVRADFPDVDPSVITAAAVTSYADVMRVLEPVNTVVAIRYHNIQCALKLAKPTIAIGYSQKHRMLMENMGVRDFCRDVRVLDIDELVKLFMELENSAAELRKKLADRNSVKKELLDEQFARLSVLLFGTAGRTAVADENSDETGVSRMKTERTR
jgi:polysaccharide pyruvyl transferase WcaK-like protein